MNRFSCFLTGALLVFFLFESISSSAQAGAATSTVSLATASPTVPAAQPAEHSSDEPDQTELIAALIVQLGADEFSQREEAMRQLIRIGAPAIEQLEVACMHADREVRFRAQRATTTIKKNDLQTRIDRFTQGEITDGEELLPGWDRFSHVAGDTIQTRRFFVDMQKHEYALLKHSSASVEEISDEMSLRASQLYAAYREPMDRVDAASVAGVLLLAGLDEVEVDDQTFVAIYYLCSNVGFYDAIHQGRDRDILKQLMARWIVKSTEASTYQAMILSMRCEVPEGLSLAVKVLEDPAAAGALEKRYAIQMLAKFGNDEHLTILEPLLEDETRISARLLGNQTLVTQIRDLALATSIRLAGERVEDFGFRNVSYHEDFVFLESSLGFFDDEARMAARSKWFEHLANSNQP